MTTDLFGRGYSEAPERPYDAHLYILQLALLMQYIGWDQADVVGFSMVCPAEFPSLLVLIVSFIREERLLLHSPRAFRTL
jgi:hypothetical protein